MAQKSRTQQLNGLTSLAYLGVLPSSPTNFIIEQHAPTSSDYRNVYVGDIWLDNSSMYATPPTAPTGFNLWILVDVAGHFATWINFGAGMVTSVGAGHDIFITGSPTSPIVNVTNAITLGDLAVLAPGTPGLTMTTGDIHLDAGTASATTNQKIVFGPSNNNISFLYNNVFIGESAGNDTMTAGSAIFDIGIGPFSLNSLTTGPGNICVGNGTGKNITTGSSNCYYGYTSGQANISGSENSGYGDGALTLSTSGDGNSAFGSGALIHLLTGATNVAVGENSGSNYASSESNNIVIGASNSGVAGETGVVRIGAGTGTSNNYNTFVGFQSGNSTYNITNSYANTCLGYQSGNTLDGTVLLNYGNTLIGYKAGKNVTNGVDNVAVGQQSLGVWVSAPSGASGANTAIGTFSGFSLIDGTYNCLLGDSAGFGLVHGNFNVIIDVNGSTGNYTGSESSNILLRNDGVLGESNVMRLGTSGSGNEQVNKTFIAGIRGVTTANANAVAVLVDSAGQLGVTSSSLRYKENVHDMESLSDCLYSLRPVVFNYKTHHPESKSVGLIAEEVYEICPSLVVKHDGEIETIKYHDLVPMLLNEIQKLNKRIEKLEGK